MRMQSLSPTSMQSSVDGQVRDAVMARLTEDTQVDMGDPVAVRRAVARALAAEGVVVAPATWARMVRDLVDELVGLGPIEGLLRDPDVTDVCCNGPDEIWVDRGGVMERSPASFRDVDAMVDTIRRVVTAARGRLDRSSPCVDARLASGVRLHAAIPPVVAQPTLTLRRIASVVPTWPDFEASGTVDAAARHLLVEVVRSRRNIVVCGPAGSGKTTMLSRMLSEIATDRVVVIEDTPELVTAGLHAVAMSVVPVGPDGGGVSMRNLVRQALRMRPDRIVVGEVRGGEVADLLQAMNTGHAGSMTTVHANGAADALVRLEGMALLAGLPLAAAHAQVSTAVDVIVALDRRKGQRAVQSVVEVRHGSRTREVVELWSR